MRALVLSGGGLFGAWQAGAWNVLARRFEPDLIVGASIGSLNGYLIASGATPAELCDYWRNPQYAGLRTFHDNLRLMTSHYSLRRPFAVTVTDILRMRPEIVRGADITWRHLAASCAVPLALPQVKIGGRWYSDGGLLNSLPVWAAVDLGATEVVALQVLGRFPSPVLAPAVRAFRFAFGHRLQPDPGVNVAVWEPSRRLGNLRDTLAWNRENIEAWIALGEADAQRLVTEKSFSF
jgi:NTE family protein